MKGLPGTRKGRTWIAQAAEGGGPKGARGGHGVFDFFYPLSRLRLFFAPFDPGGRLQWVHSTFLGRIWGTLVVGGQNAHPVLLFTRHQVRPFFH